MKNDLSSFFDLDDDVEDVEDVEIDIFDDDEETDLPEFEKIKDDESEGEIDEGEGEEEMTDDELDEFFNFDEDGEERVKGWSKTEVNKMLDSMPYAMIERYVRDKKLQNIMKNEI